MSHYRVLGALIITSYIITGCTSGAKRAVGIESAPPDEFAVVATPELVIPPNFELRPPFENGKREGQSSSAEFFPTKKQATSSTHLSQGEASLLTHIQPGNADQENIRTLIDAEYARSAGPVAGPGEAEPGVLKRLMSIKKYQSHDAAVVDSVKERKRIEENKKTGKSINDGQTPVIKKSSSVLKEVFGQ